MKLLNDLDRGNIVVESLGGCSCADMVVGNDKVFGVFLRLRFYQFPDGFYRQNGINRNETIRKRRNIFQMRLPELVDGLHAEGLVCVINCLIYQIAVIGSFWQFYVLGFVQAVILRNNALDLSLFILRQRIAFQAVLQHD